MTDTLNWHKHWAINLETASATHESGWQVRFVETGTESISEVAGWVSWTADDREWLILHAGGEAAIKKWLEEQAKAGLHDETSIGNLIAKLMREAGDLWVYHQDQLKTGQLLGESAATSAKAVFERLKPLDSFAETEPETYVRKLRNTSRLRGGRIKVVPPQ